MRNAGAIVLLVLLAYLWLRLLHDPSIRKDTTREAGVDSLRARGDSILRPDSVGKRTRDSLVVKIVTLTVDADSLTATFRGRLTDSLRVGFDSVIASKDSVIYAQGELITVQAVQLVGRDTALVRMHALLTDALGRIKPGRHLHCGPTVGAGVTPWGGTGVFLGAGCTI